MNLETLLRDVIKPELNGIYTEPPASRAGGADMGFFCREHAYHSFFLCKMLGHDAAINRGELAFSFDDSLVYRTLGSGADHAWCQVQDIVPVDLSINFQFYETRPPNVDIVYGSGQRGAYSISYLADVDEYERWVDAESPSPRIAYLKRETVGISAIDLLDDAYRFLVKPPSGGMGKIFGRHIFSSINLHLLDLANGKTKRLTSYKDSRSTVRTIGSRYPQAIEKVKQLVR